MLEAIALELLGDQHSVLTFDLAPGAVAHIFWDARRSAPERARTWGTSSPTGYASSSPDRVLVLHIPAGLCAMQAE